MRPTIILVAPPRGGPLHASSTSGAHALGCTSTDINVLGSLPGSTGVFRLAVNNHAQSVWNYFGPWNWR